MRLRVALLLFGAGLLLGLAGGCAIPIARDYADWSRTWGATPNDAKPWSEESCSSIAMDVEFNRTVRSFGARKSAVFDFLVEHVKGDEEENEWLGELARAWDSDETGKEFLARCIANLERAEREAREKREGI